MDELKLAAEKVLAAWKEIPDANREAFNNAAGELVSELRGMNTTFEANFEASDKDAEKEEDATDTTGANATAAKVGDVCTLEGGAEGVLEEQDVDGQTKLVCVAKAA